MAVAPYGTNTVTLSQSGFSDAIHVAAGDYDIELFASPWDGSNPVSVQFASENVDDRYQAIPDPFNDDAALSRIENGNHIVTQLRSGFLRINAPTIGTTTGLTMVVKPAGKPSR